MCVFLATRTYGTIQFSLDHYYEFQKIEKFSKYGQDPISMAYKSHWKDWRQRVFLNTLSSILDLIFLTKKIAQKDFFG